MRMSGQPIGWQALSSSKCALEFCPWGLGDLSECKHIARTRTPRFTLMAEPEAKKAINILKVALARPDDDYEDLGRVTDALLDALSLQPGMWLPSGECPHSSERISR